jgi:ATP-dependent DNA helicase RecG
MVKATEVLFCDNNRLEVQAAVFAGTDKLTFLDIRQLKGNIFDLLEQSTMYLKEHMNWRAKLTGEGREEIPEVPVRALEEAVVNSFCHRDYSNPKGNEIAFFKNRIEIYNPGQFPEDYTPEDFIKGTEKSILRNPLIANVLYLRKDIEKWGSGLRRISEACKEAHIKVEFKKLKSGFSVIFYRNENIPPKITPQVTPQVKLTELESKIIHEITKNQKISRSQLAEKLGISQDTIKEYMEKLKKKKVIKRRGKTSSGYWEILQS